MKLTLQIKDLQELLYQIDVLERHQRDDVLSFIFLFCSGLPLSSYSLKVLATQLPLLGKLIPYCPQPTIN